MRGLRYAFATSRTLIQLPDLRKLFPGPPLVFCLAHFITLFIVRQSHDYDANMKYVTPHPPIPGMTNTPLSVQHGTSYIPKEIVNDSFSLNRANGQVLQYPNWAYHVNLRPNQVDSPLKLRTPSLKLVGELNSTYLRPNIALIALA
ncbi:MAG: hypothetical protein ABI298_02235 [Acidimicrobiales bacterium]